MDMPWSQRTWRPHPENNRAWEYFEEKLSPTRWLLVFRRVLSEKDPEMWVLVYNKSWVAWVENGRDGIDIDMLFDSGAMHDLLLARVQELELRKEYGAEYVSGEDGGVRCAGDEAEGEALSNMGGC